MKDGSPLPQCMPGWLNVYTTALHKIGHEIGVQDYITKCFAIIDPNHQRKSCRDTMKIETPQFWDSVIDLFQPGNSDSAICLDNCRWVRGDTVPRLQSHQDQSCKMAQHPHCFEKRWTQDIKWKKAQTTTITAWIWARTRKDLMPPSKRSPWVSSKPKKLSNTIIIVYTNNTCIKTTTCWWFAKKEHSKPFGKFQTKNYIWDHFWFQSFQSASTTHQDRKFTFMLIVTVLRFKTLATLAHPWQQPKQRPDYTIPMFFPK